MDFKNVKKQFAVTAVAGICGLSASFAVLPSPNADASILGILVNSASQYAEVYNELSYYDNDPTGRQQLFEQMKASQGVNDDEYLNSRLDNIMGRLTAGIAAVDPSINEKPYNYFVNSSQEYNASCGMGHDMTVNTGIFNLLQNDDELAVVLGHEMGHGQKDHVASSIKKKIPLELGAQILSEQTGSSLQQAALGVFVNYTEQVSIGRADEWEADNLSFDYITHAGYNPGACAAVWQRFIEEMGNNGSNFVGEIFSPSDHPSNEQRRTNYEKKLNEYSGKHVSVKDARVQINGKDFVSPTAAGGMSAAERSYFVAGNLAAAYHNGQNTGDAYTADDGTVMLGNQAIITPADGDPDSSTLVTLLNTIK